MDNDLADRRARLGWSQAALAERLGVSRQTVISIERGRFDPSLPLAFRIAAASSTALTSSGLGRRPSRSTGPEIETAPSTVPDACRTGADRDATPGSRSAMLWAHPRRRTSSSVRAVKLADGSRRVTSSDGAKASRAWAADPAVMGSRAPTGTVSRRPLVRSAAATQTRVPPSRT
jgi:putative transcriptional regulator